MKKPKAEQVAGLTWPEEPARSEDGSNVYWTWLSFCGTYKVQRVVQKLGGADGYPHSFAAFKRSVAQCWLDNRGDKMKVPKDVTTWRSVELKGDRGQAGNYPRRYRTLNSALEACDAHHARAHGGAVSPPGNRGQTVREAERQGLADVPALVARDDRPARPRPERPPPPPRTAAAPPAPEAPEQHAREDRRPPRRGSPVVGDRSVSDVLVWMGQRGWSYAQVRKVLSATGHGDTSENTMKSRVGAGRSGRLAVTLSPAEESRLESLRDA